MFNWLKYKIARIISRKSLKDRLNTCYSNGDQQRVILLNVPSHGNLGDHLISVAEKQLVKDIKGYEPLTFTTADLYYGLDLIENFIKPNDVILITGGGYLGSLWPDEDARVLKIVNDLKKNTIIVMPQTVYYDKNDITIRMIEEASSIYNGHNDFFLTVRENESRKVVSSVLKLSEHQFSLLPDMALYLNFSKHDKDRDGIIICMRNDKEKRDNEHLMMLIENSIKGQGVKYLDTQICKSVSQSEEYQEVFNLIEQFQSAQLVITDRLHGMLYATICGTPVIALDNYNHKVKNVYDCWLKDLDYVRFVDNAVELSKSMTELLDNGSGRYDPTAYQSQLQSYFKTKI